MTSSIRRLMSLANKVAIWLMLGDPSKDLWAIIVLGIEDAHETQPGRTVEITGIEEDRRHENPAFQLLQERESPIDRKEGACAGDEYKIGHRLGRVRHPPGNQFDKGLVVLKEVRDRLNGFLQPNRFFRFAPLVQRSFSFHRCLQAFSQGDRCNAFSLVLEARLQARDRRAKRELLLRVITEDRIRHVVIGADLIARIGKREHGFQIITEASFELRHAASLSANSKVLRYGRLTCTRLPATW